MVEDTVHQGISRFVQKTIRGEHSKRLLSNFLSLSVLQAANYILPLLTLPYLIRVLGPEKFGVLAFAAAVVGYFTILTDYGFNLSATRSISIHRDDKAKLSEIFSSVMCVKAVLILASAFVLGAVVMCYGKTAEYWPVYLFTFGTVIGQGLFPIWFFQGMQEMKYVTYFNIFAKLVFTVSIFIFVKKEADFALVPALTSAGSMIAGICSLYVVSNKYKVRIRIPSLAVLIAELKNGWYVFAATSFASLYRESNTIILGAMAPNIVVGYYAIAEKIIKSIQGLQSPLGQTLFPYLSQKSHKVILEDYIMKYARAVFFVYLAVLVFALFFSSWIVRILTGGTEAHVLTDFRILAGIILVGGMNFYFGVLGLLALGRSRDFTRAVALAGISNIFLCAGLSYLMQDVGTSIAVLASEVVLLIAILSMIRAQVRLGRAA